MSNCLNPRNLRDLMARISLIIRISVIKFIEDASKIVEILKYFAKCGVGSPAYVLAIPWIAVYANMTMVDSPSRVDKQSTEWPSFLKFCPENTIFT